MELFQISVTVIEARHLPKLNVNTLVEIAIDKRRERFHAKTKKTSNPHFNENSRFKFKTDLKILLHKRLILSLYSKKFMGVRKTLIGSSKIELATIWAQPYHQFHNKWVILFKPNDPLRGVRGYLKCSISILSEDQTAVVPLRNSGSQIEGNLMAPAMGIAKNQKAFFCINVYRADGVITSEEYSNMYVNARFADETNETQVSSHRANPVWNEALVFSEALPNLFQTISLELWDHKQKAYIGGLEMTLNQLSLGYELGIPPTFGPSFVYLKREAANNLQPPTYACRLLVSFSTEIIEDVNAANLFSQKAIAPLDESRFGAYEEFTLFFTVFQSNFFISKLRGKEFIVKIRHGEVVGRADAVNNNKNNQNDPESVSSLKYQNQTGDTNAKLECAELIRTWPQIYQREWRQNYIKNTFQRILDRLFEEVSKFRKLNIDSETEFLDEIRTCCDETLVLPGNFYFTPLEVAQRNMLHEELQKILQIIRLIQANRSRILFDELIKCVVNVLRHTEEISPTFPEIELEITFPNKNTTFHKCLKASDYLHAHGNKKKGGSCGKFETIWITDSSSNDVASLDALLWLGKTSELSDCFHSLPKESIGTNSLGQWELELNENHCFELRVHVYQGRISSVLTTNELVNSFVRVSVFEETKDTEVKRHSLNPIWDETIIFPKISLMGDAEHISAQSIGVIFELLNSKGERFTEPLGRGVVRPVVTLKSMPYLPPRLRWEKCNTGDDDVGILMAMELIETVNGSEEQHDSSTKYSIPSNVRPHLVNYCLEISMWGLRNVRGSWSTCNPKALVIVECNQARVETNVVKISSFVKFNSHEHLAEVSLPIEEEYTPPMILTLYEVGLMRKLSYKGSCVIQSLDMFMIDLGEYEDERSNIFINGAIKNIDTFDGRTIQNYDYIDWWSKYFASKENSHKKRLLKIYGSELEKQSEFNGFQDVLAQFDLVTRKSSSSPCSSSINSHVALLKASIRLHPFSLPKFQEKKSMLAPFPSNEPLEVIIRVYIVAAYNLPSTDVNGRCDPYVSIVFGNKKISDRKNYIFKDVNPIFGKCFELKGTLPRDNSLTVRILDHDVCLCDDLIGSTTIDIENRYYTLHHASCGISDTYEEDGPCQWRDILKPSEILHNICHHVGLPEPVFTEQSLLLGDFQMARNDCRQEELALGVLKDFGRIPNFGFELVPEHVETRSLFNPKMPYIEQGKLEMWIDIFPNTGVIPPPVKITPRPPLEMELRVVIWKVVDVLLTDYNYITGVRSSDIYCKAWLTTKEDSQRTDTHKNSTTGEGVFNWRCIFQFEYSTTERKMVVKRKVEFSKEPWPEKLPCVFEIQVWDEDVFGDDFIGSLSLNLRDMPVGKKLAKACSLKMIDSKSDSLDLFEAKKVRGWWPLRAKGEDNYEDFSLAGKIDLEFELFTNDDAKKSPAGSGRNGPQALPVPTRPKNVPFWKNNPLTFTKSILFPRMKKQIIIFGIIFVIGLMSISTLTALPEFLLEKMAEK